MDFKNFTDDDFMALFMALRLRQEGITEKLEALPKRIAEAKENGWREITSALELDSERLTKELASNLKLLELAYNGRDEEYRRRYKA
ncbi:MAG: hypothetical protein LBU77_05450 [Clostridiales bacterium]|nr:hypothetical protein [Clostridiales bacterium]